jgi:hypothetical protein
MTPLDEARLKHWQDIISGFHLDTVIPSDYLILAQAWALACQDFPEDTLEEIAVAARVPLEDARALLALPAHHMAFLVAYRNPGRRAEQLPKPAPHSIWEHVLSEA